MPDPLIIMAFPKGVLRSEATVAVGLVVSIKDGMAGFGFWKADLVFVFGNKGVLLIHRTWLSI
jgi:hypothetical protein